MNSSDQNSGATEISSDTRSLPGAQKPKPHFFPRKPPPRQVKRFDADDLPPVGTWVSVQWRRDTVLGRVVISEPTRIRLRFGAGFWEIPMNEISRIVAAPDPRTGTPRPVAEPIQIVDVD